MSKNLLSKLSKTELFRLLKKESLFQFPTELAVDIVDELMSRGIEIKTNNVFYEARKKYEKLNRKERR